MRVLVTGANGFVGRHMVAYLTAQNIEVVATTRRDYGDLSSHTQWAQLLSGITHVVHCAAAVHNPSGPREWFWRVNVEATQALANACVAAGVQRLVFLSTVKVIGEGRAAAYTNNDVPKPEGGYAESKLAAETLLLSTQGLEVVILRPPLVYGEGVGANFLALFKLVAKGFWLPFGAINNARSLIYVGNLVEAVALCVQHKNAVGKAFLLHDGASVSTPELVTAMAQALSKKPRLLALPVWMFRLVGALTGKQAAVSRLLGSLHVEDDRIRRELGFIPPYTFQQGLTNTAKWFTNEDHASALPPR